MDPSQRPSFEDVLLRLRGMGGAGGGGITPVEAEPLSDNNPLGDMTEPGLKAEVGLAGQEEAGLEAEAGLEVEAGLEA